MHSLTYHFSPFLSAVALTTLIAGVAAVLVLLRPSANHEPPLALWTASPPTSVLRASHPLSSASTRSGSVLDVHTLPLRAAPTVPAARAAPTIPAARAPSTSGRLSGQQTPTAALLGVLTAVGSASVVLTAWVRRQISQHRSSAAAVPPPLSTMATSGVPRRIAAARMAAAVLGVAAAAGPATAKDPREDKPVVVILRCSEVTYIQEQLLRDLGTGARKDFRLAPAQMALSIKIFLGNSKLAEQFAMAIEQHVAPADRPKAKAFANQAIRTLQEIPRVGFKGQEPFLTSEQLLEMADLYNSSRRYMRQFCDLLPQDVLSEAKAINQALNAQSM